MKDLVLAAILAVITAAIGIEVGRSQSQTASMGISESADKMAKELEKIRILLETSKGRTSSTPVQ